MNHRPAAALLFPFSIALLLVACSIETSEAAAIGFDGSTVSYAGYCCTGIIEPDRVTNILTTTVGPGVEFTAAQTQASSINPFLPVIGADYNVGTSTIVVQNLTRTATFVSGAFNGPVLSFSGLATPISSVKIDPLSTSPTPTLILNSAQNQIGINVAGLTMTPSSRLLLDASFASPSTNTYTPDVPTPTSTPSISKFPMPSQLYSTIGTFSTNSQFSTPTQAFNSSQISLLGALANAYKTGAQQAVNTWTNNSGGVATADLIASGPPVDTTSAITALFPYFLNVSGVTASLPNYVQFTSDAMTTIYAAAASNPFSAFVAGTLFLTRWLVIPGMSVIANDPPDPNYRQVVSATFPQIPAVPETGDVNLDQLLAELAQQDRLANGYLHALNVSFDRYSSAYDAGNAISAGLQVSAMLDYMALLQKTIRQIGVIWAQLPGYLQALGFSPNVDMQSYFEQLQAQLASVGLPSDLEALLLKDGFSQDDINTGIQQFLAVQGSGLSGAISGLYAGQANAFEKFGARTVPEPATIALLGVGLAGLGFSRRRKRA